MIYIQSLLINNISKILQRKIWQRYAFFTLKCKSNYRNKSKILHRYMKFFILKFKFINSDQR